MDQGSWRGLSSINLRTIGNSIPGFRTSPQFYQSDSIHSEVANNAKKCP
ncbi:Hypothetical protein Minf_0862 [Methylacidiphilum infernorum V4]|uniref:Uncharacterized protein n=1 Tax=Methylacidiphilum infernorum (isolate V4) TaxID=481448 RepID=B3E1C1_METI4|nr:Hypothetical protein Minf_0862 [Methylacidiphilum infernorum V4]